MFSAYKTLTIVHLHPRLYLSSLLCHLVRTLRLDPRTVCWVLLYKRTLVPYNTVVSSSPAMPIDVESFNNQISKALRSYRPNPIEVDGILNEGRNVIYVARRLSFFQFSTNGGVLYIVRGICDILHTLQPAFLDGIEILTYKDLISIRASISEEPDGNPPTKLKIRENAWWSGGLLTALLPDLQSLELHQGFPSSFSSGSVSCPNLTRFLFKSGGNKEVDTYNLEKSLLEFLDNCPSLKDATLIYRNLQGWALPLQIWTPHRPVELYLHHLESFTQFFYSDGDGKEEEKVPIDLFNNLVLPPKCNVALEDEDTARKRSWDDSFPISPYLSSELSQHPHIKVRISVHLERETIAVVGATFSFLDQADHKISLVKRLRLEYYNSRPIFEHFMDFLEFLTKKLESSSFKILNLELLLDDLGLDKLIIPEGVLEEVQRLEDRGGSKRGTVSLVIKHRSKGSSEELELCSRK